MINIGPDVWGPHGWKFLHFIALAYPNEPTEEKKNHYRQFFESLQHMLPCSLCANNYKRHFYEDLPLTDEVLENRDNLVKWTIDLHNLVNKETGKPVLDYEYAINLIANNFPDNINDIEVHVDVPPVMTKQDKPVQVDQPIQLDQSIHAPIQPINSINKNIEFNAKNFKDRKDKKQFENNSSPTTFGSLSFWLIIFLVLITIAVVYKKG